MSIWLRCRLKDSKVSPLYQLRISTDGEVSLGYSSSLEYMPLRIPDRLSHDMTSGSHRQILYMTPWRPAGEVYTEAELLRADVAQKEQGISRLGYERDWHQSESRRLRQENVESISILEHQIGRMREERRMLDKAKTRAEQRADQAETNVNNLERVIGDLQS